MLLDGWSVIAALLDPRFARQCCIVICVCLLGLCCCRLQDTVPMSGLPYHDPANDSTTSASYVPTCNPPCLCRTRCAWCASCTRTAPTCGPACWAPTASSRRAGFGIAGCVGCSCFFVGHMAPTASSRRACCCLRPCISCTVALGCSCDRGRCLGCSCIRLLGKKSEVGLSRCCAAGTCRCASLTGPFGTLSFTYAEAGLVHPGPPAGAVGGVHTTDGPSFPLSFLICTEAGLVYSRPPAGALGGVRHRSLGRPTERLVLDRV